MDAAQKIRSIEKRILFYSTIDFPGAALLGLGLYGRFGAQGDAFWAPLNNGTVVDAFIVAGVVIMAYCGFQVVKLGRQKAQLLKASGE